MILKENLHITNGFSAGWFTRHYVLYKDKLTEGEEKLTVSHQDQGTLGFGLAVVDLEGVRALAGSGEVIHCHLDDSCGHVVADLVSLRDRFMVKLPPTDTTITSTTLVEVGPKATTWWLSTD